MEYHRETGTRIQDRYFTRDESDVEEYIEWLEERLLDDEALFILMNKILNGKNDKAQEHIHGPDE